MAETFAPTRTPAPVGKPPQPVHKPPMARATPGAGKPPPPHPNMETPGGKQPPHRVEVKPKATGKVTIENAHKPVTIAKEFETAKPGTVQKVMGGKQVVGVNHAPPAIGAKPNPLPRVDATKQMRDYQKFIADRLARLKAENAARSAKLQRENAARTAKIRAENLARDQQIKRENEANQRQARAAYDTLIAQGRSEVEALRASALAASRSEHLDLGTMREESFAPPQAQAASFTDGSEEGPSGSGGSSGGGSGLLILLAIAGVGAFLLFKG